MNLIVVSPKAIVHPSYANLDKQDLKAALLRDKASINEKFKAVDDPIVTAQVLTALAQKVQQSKNKRGRKKKGAKKNYKPSQAPASTSHS